MWCVNVSSERQSHRLTHVHSSFMLMCDLQCYASALIEGTRTPCIVCAVRAVLADVYQVCATNT